MGTRSISGVHQIYAAPVLIVEDDQDSADLFSRWLGDAGVGVAIVNDADEAIKQAMLLRPAVAVIDLGLPTTDGIALIRMLRALPALRCAYVAVTAYAGVRLPALCEAAGFAAFYQKPVTGSALVSRVLTMLNNDGRARYR